MNFGPVRLKKMSKIGFKKTQKTRVFYCFFRKKIPYEPPRMTQKKRKKNNVFPKKKVACKKKRFVQKTYLFFRLFFFQKPVNDIKKIHFFSI